MNSLHADLTRAVVDTRRAEASRRRLAAEAKGLRRRTRPAAACRTEGWLRLWRRRAPSGTDPAPTTTPWPRPVPITRHRQPGAAAVLAPLLALVAERVAEHGTAAEARVLEMMSAAVRRTSPGAAAALVDWQGTEIARLRAYGVAHGIVLGDLGPGAQSALLDQILGTDLALAG